MSDWPQIETVALLLVDDIPAVLKVLSVTHRNFVLGKVWLEPETELQTYS